MDRCVDKRIMPLSCRFCLPTLPTSPGPGKPAVCSGGDLARGVPHQGGEGQQKTLRVYHGEGGLPLPFYHVTLAAVLSLLYVALASCGCNIIILCTRAEDSRVLRNGCLLALAMAISRPCSEA